MTCILQKIEQLYATYSRQVRIDKKAGLAPWAVGREECFSIFIILDDLTIVLQYAAYRSADLVVVVDDENNGCGSYLVGLSRRSDISRDRFRHEKAPDNGGQLTQARRLVEMNAFLLRDIPQGFGRYIAGENNDRHRSTQFFLQFCGNLQSIHPVRQIVVGQDQVGSEHAVFDHT